MLEGYQQVPYCSDGLNQTAQLAGDTRSLENILRDAVDQGYTTYIKTYTSSSTATTSTLGTSSPTRTIIARPTHHHWQLAIHPATQILILA